MIIVMGVVFSLVLGVFNHWLSDTYAQLTYAQRMVRYRAAVEVGREIHRYYDNHKTLPPAGTTIWNLPGYEQLKTWDLPYVSQLFTSSLNDGIWTFQRAVFAVPDPQRMGEFNGASPLSASFNQCGTGDAATGLDWCPPKNGFYVKFETRSQYVHDIKRASEKMKQTGFKFAMEARAAGKFPVAWSGHSNLAYGAGEPLPLLVGYTGTADNCSGTFTFDGVVLDCSDLFGRWGNPLVYTVISGTEIGLSTQTSFDVGGSPYDVAVVTDLPL